MLTKNFYLIETTSDVKVKVLLIARYFHSLVPNVRVYEPLRDPCASLSRYIRATRKATINKPAASNLPVGRPMTYAQYCALAASFHILRLKSTVTQITRLNA
jgi:hypothetical protein